MMVIPPLGTAVTQAVFWRIPNLVILLPLAKLVLPLVPAGFVIRLGERQEFVRQQTLVETPFWMLERVATMEILLVATTVLLHV
jgi:hypothetical protein